MSQAAIETDLLKLWRYVKGFLQVDEHRANRNVLRLPEPPNLEGALCSAVKYARQFRFIPPMSAHRDTTVCRSCPDAWDVERK